MSTLGELLESGALDQPGAPMYRGDIETRQPRPPWWSGMFSHKPIRGRVEGIDKPIPRSLESRAYDYLPSWVREGAKKSFSAIPPEGWIMASFIGPKGAANLAAAKIRRPDDWGGSNRLRAAEEHPQWGKPDAAARREIWKAFGWSDPATFGTHGMGRGAQPVTVVPTPEFAVRMEAMRPMETGGRTIHKGEAKVPELLTGIDEVLAAEPSLRDVALRLTLDPALKIETGSTMPLPIWKNNVKRIGEDPVGWKTGTIEARGYDVPSLTNTVGHEVLGHGVALPQGITPMEGIRTQRMNPVRGTVAEAKAARAADMAKSRRDELTKSDLAMLDEMAAKIRTEAGYRALAEEIMARARVVGLRQALAEWKKTPPALIDTYQPGALGKGIEAQEPLPLSDYRPPWLKKPE